MNYLQRPLDQEEISNRINVFPVTAILGSRQCGKTTLSRQFKSDHYFDLENPRDLSKLDNPQLALEDLKGLIVIDEIQRAPELFTLIRYLVDHNPDQKYLILGSASRDLIRQSSESLAGRISYYILSGFRLTDIDRNQLKDLWFRGGYPRSFIATEEESRLWRENYIQTFLERDIPQLGIRIPSGTLRRFWTMLSHYHGQVVNYSELGRSFGISDMTIRRYIEILEGTFMLRVLHPWYENIGKRLVKKPKIYLKDSGLFHSLMNIDSFDSLISNPKLGASWEGFVIECVSRVIKPASDNLYFWRTHSGSEIDLFWQKDGKNWGLEVKYADAPKLTKSMRVVVEDLSLEHLWIIYPGPESYQLSDSVTVSSLIDFLNR